MLFFPQPVTNAKMSLNFNNNLKGGTAPERFTMTTNVKYKIINNGNFKIGKKSFPDWRVQQVINGELESEWDGSWTQAYAK